LCFDTSSGGGEADVVCGDWTKGEWESCNDERVKCVVGEKASWRGGWLLGLEEHSRSGPWRTRHGRDS